MSCVVKALKIRKATKNLNLKRRAKESALRKISAFKINGRKKKFFDPVYVRHSSQKAKLMIINIINKDQNTIISIIRIL